MTWGAFPVAKRPCNHLHTQSYNNRGYRTSILPPSHFIIFLPIYDTPRSATRRPPPAILLGPNKCRPMHEPSKPHFALVCSFGRGVNLKYGLTIFISGQIFLASSVLTLGWTITSSPANLSAAATRDGLSLVKEKPWHTWGPIDWGSDFVLVACLQRVHDAQYLSRVTTSRGWV